MGKRMERLSDYTLDELLETARRLHALDEWEKRNGSVVFRLGNQSITIREPNAPSFARGLIRGYIKAANLYQDREDLSNLR